jgi:hypothetical protein
MGGVTAHAPEFFLLRLVCCAAFWPLLSYRVGEHTVIGQGRRVFPPSSVVRSPAETLLVYVYDHDCASSLCTAHSRLLGRMQPSVLSRLGVAHASYCRGSFPRGMLRQHVASL